MRIKALRPCRTSQCSDPTVNVSEWLHEPLFPGWRACMVFLPYSRQPERLQIANRLPKVTCAAFAGIRLAQSIDRISPLPQDSRIRTPANIM